MFDLIFFKTYNRGENSNKPLEECKMTKGIVKWFDVKKGYGFIIYGEDEEIFVHFTAIDQDGFKTLFEGQNVTFEIKEGSRGAQASHVKVIETKSVD